MSRSRESRQEEPPRRSDHVRAVPRPAGRVRDRSRSSSPGSPRSSRRSSTRTAARSTICLALQDFRFLPALMNVGIFLLLYVPAMLIVVALHVAAARHRARPLEPSAAAHVHRARPSLTGATAVLVWYFLLEPTLSPYQSVLHALGITQGGQIWQAGNLAWIFVLMAFFTGRRQLDRRAVRLAAVDLRRDPRGGAHRRRQRLADRLAHQAAARSRSTSCTWASWCSPPDSRSSSNRS